MCEHVLEMPWLGPGKMKEFDCGGSRRHHDALQEMEEEQRDEGVDDSTPSTELRLDAAQGSSPHPELRSSGRLDDRQRPKLDRGGERFA